MPEMPPPTVTVARPVVRAVDEFYDFIGTTVAVEQVDIRARVQGFLEKVHFVEGSRVKQGDPLFEIERTAYQAIRDQAYAQLQSRQAERVRARLDLERVEQAIKTNAVSQQEVTTRRAQHDQAEAYVAAAEATLKQADLDLSYTRIVSPIDGRISRRYVDAGNLVGAGQQTLLATVVRLQPMYVQFYVSEGFLGERLGVGAFDGGSTRPFFIARENEPDFPHAGILNYMDNRVDEGTGTLLLRGELPNADEAFLPGMFVRVRVPVGTQADAICVHDRALGTDIGGKFLLLVDPEGVVRRRPVGIGRLVGEMRVIPSGLSADEAYILQGAQFVFPGMKVNTVFEGQTPAAPAESNGPDAVPAQE
ncbi:MAG TPA: efflux RND transporter periplasmic adaptor subunit [Phycisphaerales bacterium]|nr:efflux RND transporter periplasmic adaptor subunit [Phycisphaerales bacterium]